MRTTLTLDPDVAVLLEEERERSRRSLKAVINDALRRGLAETEGGDESGEPYETPPADLGRCLLPDLDDVGSVLAAAEGDAFR